MKKRNIEIALECFVKKNGRYLMLKRANNKRIMPGIWMAPGGRREFNEGLFEAARREIFEETGLKIRNIKVKAVGNAYLKDLDTELHFHFLLADYKSGNLKRDIHEGELQWLTPEEIKNLPTLLSEIHHVLPYLFDHSKNVISYKAVYTTGNVLKEFNIEDS